MKSFTKKRRPSSLSSVSHVSAAKSIKSAFGTDKEHCLCTAFRPILRFCQLCGILPVSHNAATCKLIHSWKSIPVAINLCLVFLNIGGLLHWYPLFYAYLRSNLQGIDFYSTIVAVTIQTLATSTLFIFGNLSAINFTKAWEKLHTTIDEMGMQNFRFIKYLVYCVPIYLIQEAVGNSVMAFMYVYVSGMKIGDQNFHLRSTGFMANFLPNLASLTFALLCFIVSKHFSCISERLQKLKDKLHREILATDDTFSNECNHNRTAEELAQLRIHHENLCDSVRKLERAFGIQMIAIFTATGFSFVVGVYSLVTTVDHMPKEHRLESLLKLCANALMPIYAGMRILLIVCCCQALMNNANEAGHILNSFDIDESPKEVRVQIRKFLDKVGLFPLRITALGVFEMGSSFIASAAGNIITYVLVLMQFRIEHPNGFWSTNINTNDTSSIFNDSATYLA